MEDITYGGMYLVIPASVAEDIHLRERSKLIYGRIVQLAFASGYCYASNKALLKILTHADPKTGAVDTISERTLQSILAELRDRGHIHMDTGPIPTPAGSKPVIRRRIFIGQKLADMPPEEGVQKISPPENNCTGGVQKISPPLYICNNNTSINICANGEADEVSELDKLFDQFWAAYPKKRGKENARKAWKKLSPDKELCRRMAKALKWQKESSEWTRDGGQYIPYPATWLNGRRWEDVPDTEPPDNGKERYI